MASPACNSFLRGALIEAVEKSHPKLTVDVNSVADFRYSVVVSNLDEKERAARDQVHSLLTLHGKRVPIAIALL